MPRGRNADTSAMSICLTDGVISPAKPKAGRARLLAESCSLLAAGRAHRVICFIACIWVLNGFDLALTALAHRHGLLLEQNPVAHHLLEQGLPLLALYKLGLVALGSYPLVRFRRTGVSEAGAAVVLLLYAFVAVRWSACLDMYTVSTTARFSLAEFQALLAGSRS